MPCQSRERQWSKQRVGDGTAMKYNIMAGNHTAQPHLEILCGTLKLTNCVSSLPTENMSSTDWFLLFILRFYSRYRRFSWLRIIENRLNCKSSRTVRMQQKPRCGHSAQRNLAPAFLCLLYFLLQHILTAWHYVMNGLEREKWEQYRRATGTGIE